MGFFQIPHPNENVWKPVRGTYRTVWAGKIKIDQGEEHQIIGKANVELW
jgi:hypothetical protein